MPSGLASDSLASQRCTTRRPARVKSAGAGCDGGLRLEPLVEDPRERPRSAVRSRGRRRRRSPSTKPSRVDRERAPSCSRIRSPGSSSPRSRSASPSMLFRWRSKAGHAVAEPSPRLVVEHAGVAVVVDRDESSSCRRLRRARRRAAPDERARPLGASSPRSCGSAPQRPGISESPARVQKRVPWYETSTGSVQRASYDARSSAVTSPPRSSISSTSASAIVPRRRARALVGERLERAGRAPAGEQSPVAEQLPSGRVDPRALVHRHHRLEHPRGRPRGRRAAGPRRARAAAPARPAAPRAGARARARARRAPRGRPAPRTSRCRPRSARARAEGNLELHERTSRGSAPSRERRRSSPGSAPGPSRRRSRSRARRRAGPSSPSPRRTRRGEAAATAALRRPQDSAPASRIADARRSARSRDGAAATAAVAAFMREVLRPRSGVAPSRANGRRTAWLLPYPPDRSLGRARSFPRRAGIAESRHEGDAFDPHQGSKAGDHREPRQHADRHGLAARADRAPHAAHQRAHGAPAGASRRTTTRGAAC